MSVGFPSVVCIRILTGVSRNRSAREAIQQRFPKADLSVKKQFLNETIDKILSQS